ncbi:MAG: hypothetical protein QXJ64_10410 [Thermosphaera sp.]
MNSKKTYTHIILEYLSTYPGASIKDVSKSTGLPQLIVRKILYRLKNDNYVEKSGKGYILTQKGQGLLNYISSKSLSQDRDQRKNSDVEPVKNHKEFEVSETPSGTEKVETPVERKMFTNDLTSRVEALEKRLLRLEKEIEEVKKALSGLGEMKRESKPLSSPVMTYSDAQNLLGNLFERMLYEGRLIRVGRLIVDKAFFEEFKKKFPLKTSDIEKLSDAEKILLEEMRREALVILYAGRELRLVEK